MNKMHSVIIFLLHVWCAMAAYEGESCTGNNGKSGICKNIMKCADALVDLRRGVQPSLCTFENDVPIVCCVQKTAAPPPPPQTRPRPTTTTTTEYTPAEEVYVNLQGPTVCKPIRNFTASSTDRISWKKCLQYQEELVYPCKLDPLGNKARGNNCKHVANKLITGGVDAGVAEFPHMVMLSYSVDIDSFESGCGGTLLSDWYILTAAHCTYKGNVGDVQYAATGALKQSQISKTRIYKIAERIQFPQYIPNYHYFDIALLKTETRIKLDMFAVPACLDLGNDIGDSEALATGWGAMTNKGDVVDHLQKVVLKKFADNECSRYIVRDRKLPNGFQQNIQMCFGDKIESKDACGGDSGGPLQVKLQRVKCMYSIIGVTSFGRGCGTIGRPGFYTRVSPFVPWIESVVWPNE